MRRAAKVDANHATIVGAFLSVGCQVLDLSRVGQGCPDLLVAILRDNGWRNVLVEVKDGEKVASKQVLTKPQQEFFAMWKGPRLVVTSIEDALDLVRYGVI